MHNGKTETVRLRVGIGLLLLLLMAPLAPGHADVMQRIRDSQAALAEERFAEAERLGQEAVQLDAAHPPAWRQYGLALLRAGKPREAVHALQRVTVMDETDATAWRGLAQAFWETGQASEAIDAHRAYLRLNPDDAMAWRDLAAWRIRLQDEDRAVAALERAVALQPADAAVWRDLAVLHQRGGRPAEAVHAFEQALHGRAPGEDPGARRDLGWLLWTQGRRDEALTRWIEAIEAGVEAKDEVVFQVAARLLEDGATAETVAFLQRIHPGDPPTAFGLELARRGRLRAAEPLLMHVWQSGERSPDTGLYLAYARAVNAQFDGLDAFLEPLVDPAAAPTSEQADLALEVLRLGETRPEIPALALRLEAVLDGAERYAERITEILETAAKTLRLRQAPAEALTLYRRVLERDPNRMGWVWAVLLAERLEGQTPFEWLAAYLGTVDAPAIRAGVLGVQADRMNQAETAIRAIRESLALAPMQPQLRQILFERLLREGRRTEARTEADWFAQQVEAGHTFLRAYLAGMLSRLGTFHEALIHWQLLHFSNPEQPYYAIETAYALFRLHQPDAAVETLRRPACVAPHATLFEWLAEIASARGQYAHAVEWAARGLETAPSPALLRYHAENLEMVGTDPAGALASARAYLSTHPGYVPMILLVGRMLESMGLEPELRSFHAQWLERNPAFLPALSALRDSAAREGRFREAVAYARRRTELQPGHPEAARQYAHSLAQDNRYRKALQILRPLARTRTDQALAILVYRTISRPPYEGRTSVDQIERHIQRLSEEGYRLVNSFRTPEGLSDGRRTVMMILIDPAIDVIQALAPILERHDARVVYAGTPRMPTRSRPGLPFPDTLAGLLESGRWRLASVGPPDMLRRSSSPRSQPAIPSTHTPGTDVHPADAQTFRQRIDRQMSETARFVAEEPDRILVYPDGDFGQRAPHATPEEMATIQDAVARHFTYAVYFDDSGFFLREPATDPVRIPARVVPANWDADILSAYLTAGHPLVRARLELARILYWHGQHDAANTGFDRAARAGADAFEIQFNRGLNADRQGDLPTALQSLHAAQALDPASERVAAALEQTRNRRRPQFQAFRLDWRDNEDRSHARSGALADVFLAPRLRAGIAFDRNRWESKKAGREYGTRLGVQTLVFPATGVWFSGRLWRLDMDNWSGRWGGEAALRLPNPLASGSLSLTAARGEIKTLEALRADIDARIYALRTSTRLLDVFDLFADLSRIERTDDNSTDMIEGRLLYRLHEWPYAGAGWRFRWANSDTDPPAYWAPEELEQHQLHLTLRGDWKRLSGSVSADTGYARERGANWRFVWGARGVLNVSLVSRVDLNGDITWFEGPVYERLTGRVGVRGRF